jgi:hypothetical protein
MTTRLNVLLRDRLKQLAEMKVTFRAIESDLGKQIGEMHDDLRKKLIKIVESIYPVKEMKILQKWERSNACEAVDVLIEKDNRVSFLLYDFKTIAGYYIRGEFYKKILNGSSRPMPGTVAHDKVYGTLHKNLKDILPHISNSTGCRHNLYPKISNEWFYGIETTDYNNNKNSSSKNFEPILKDARILSKMLQELNLDIADKLCPYHSLIEKTNSLEAIEKMWPEAKEIALYREKDERKGICKIMGIEEAAERIKQEMFATA